jgi:hypothetical protein
MQGGRRNAVTKERRMDWKLKINIKMNVKMV